MTEQGIVRLIVIAGWIALSKASLSIGEFEKVTDGVSDNMVNWGYEAVYGDDKIWLIGVQKVDSVHSGGGIVSTLFISNKTWNHQPSALDTTTTTSTFKPFSLNGRLFTITYDNNSPDMRFKLYFWNDEEWSEVPFDTSSVESPRGLVGRNIKITVPDQSSDVAYFTASASDDTPSYESVISKLEMEFDADSKPINANLSPIDRKTRTDNNAHVLFTPVVDDQMYVFWNDGRNGYIFNLTSEDTRPLTIDENKWHSDTDFVQLRNKALFFDASYSPDMYLFDLKTEQFDGDQEVKYPFHNPDIVLDQKNEVIYAIDVDQGVYKSKIGV